MQKLIFLIVLIIGFQLSAQWGEDPFVYDEVDESAFKKTSPIKKTSRSPASVSVEIKEVEKNKQDPERLPKEVAKEIIEQDSLNSTSTIVPKQDTWEKLKTNFDNGRKVDLVEDSTDSMSKKNIEPSKLQRARFLTGLSFGFTSLEAASSYYPKVYSGDGLLLGLTASLSFSETTAGFFNYETSFGMVTKDKTDGTRDSDLDHSWLAIGWEWGSIIGSNGSSLRYQIGFREWQVKLPKSAVQKMGHTNSSGFLGVKLDIPQSENSKFGLKLNFYPSGSHSEQTSTWTDKSGDSPKVWGGDLKMDYSYQFKKGNRIKFYVESFVENVKFKGTSATTDPVLGQTIDRVNVRYTNQKFGFELLWTY